MQSGGKPLERGGIHRERQNASITLFELMRQLRDVVKQFRKALTALRQAVQFDQEIWVDRKMRVSLSQQVEDACHAADVCHNRRGDQAMSLTRWAITSIPIAPEREKWLERGIRE